MIKLAKMRKRPSEIEEDEKMKIQRLLKMEDNFKIVWSNPLILQAWGPGTREVTYSMSKGQPVEKGRNPRPPNSWP